MGEKKTEINWTHLGDILYSRCCTLSYIYYLKEWNSQIKTIETTADGFWVFLKILAPVPLCLFVLSAVLEPIIWFTVGCLPYIELPLKRTTMPENSPRKRSFMLNYTFQRSMNAINSIKVDSWKPPTLLMKWAFWDNLTRCYKAHSCCLKIKPHIFLSKAGEK